MKTNNNFNDAQLVALLKETGVIMDGHFLLTSGRHSARFLQCSQLLQYPEQAEKVCRLAAAPFKDKQVQTVIGPAMGGVIMAYETARALGARALFAERSEKDLMVLKRGFRVEVGERVLVVEDAVTTGGSVRKVFDLLEKSGVEIVGVSILIDRTAGKLKFEVPVHSLVSMDIESYAPHECPLCRDGIPLKQPKV